MMSVDKRQVRPDGSLINSEEFGFSLVCEKCGSYKTRMIPTSHYNNDYKIPSMITMHLMCTECHHEIEYVVYK